MFKQSASHPEQAIVMIFDLEGFSKFFSQPDVQSYVPKYLNTVLEAVEIVVSGGNAYYLNEPNFEGLLTENLDPLPKPIHKKFLGDGMLYIWKYHDFNAAAKRSLLNSLFNLQLHFSRINLKVAEEVPVIDIPKRVRFGIAAGSVYKLTYASGRKDEYIGYSINLASRLQTYCREIGFIASARINAPHQKLAESKYIRVIATKLRGFPNEIVICQKVSELSCLRKWTR
jgi:class 3 adenylate cyclase